MLGFALLGGSLKGTMCGGWRDLAGSSADDQAGLFGVVRAAMPVTLVQTVYEIAPITLAEVKQPRSEVRLHHDLRAAKGRRGARQCPPASGSRCGCLPQPSLRRR